MASKKKPISNAIQNGILVALLLIALKIAGGIISFILLLAIGSSGMIENMGVELGVAALIAFAAAISFSLAACLLSGYVAASRFGMLPAAAAGICMVATAVYATYGFDGNAADFAIWTSADAAIAGISGYVGASFAQGMIQEKAG
ncbi:MAG: hypothetical protein NTX79_04705 [Candidatus Micrarchaeota archaeon]|nr:hypothetical protein [Candidatus Micrarchaeota archaeon]